MKQAIKPEDLAVSEGPASVRTTKLQPFTPYMRGRQAWATSTGLAIYGFCSGGI